MTERRSAVRPFGRSGIRETTGGPNHRTLSRDPAAWLSRDGRLILAARRNGARLVVVDPYRSRTARVADEHVQPLPGTDAALALGMMRAIVDAGLADEEWCRAHAVGYEFYVGDSGNTTMTRVP